MAIHQPRGLWFLILSYSMVMVLANWFDPRLVQLGPLTTDAGTIIFPLTFLIGDLITEVYGYKHARRAIWCGFLFNALFLAYGQLIIHLPSPSFATQNAAFNGLFAADSRIVVASALSYLCAEPVNSFVMAKLKIKLQGRFMSLRFISSTALAAGMDSTIFTTLAFYGTMSDSNLVIMILTMWLIKVIIEILGLPISVSCANWLKRKEALDIYDKHTAFNLFSLDTQYTAKDNLYR